MRRKSKKKLKFRKTYFIFCEGETEKCYFEVYKKVTRENLKISVLGQVGTSDYLLGKVKNSIWAEISQKYWFMSTNLKKTNSQIFILLDTDGQNGYSQKEIEEIKDYFAEYEIKVLFSNRDFELFILLHLEYYSGTNKDYLQKIRKYFPTYEKGCNLKRKQIYEKIIEEWFDFFMENIEKVKKLHENNGCEELKGMVPFTEVGEVFG